MHMNFRLMAAMFDFPVTSMSESISTNVIVLLDLKMVGLEVVVSLLSHIHVGVVLG